MQSRFNFVSGLFRLFLFCFVSILFRFCFVSILFCFERICFCFVSVLFWKDLSDAKNWIYWRKSWPVVEHHWRTFRMRRFDLRHLQQMFGQCSRAKNYRFNGTLFWLWRRTSRNWGQRLRGWYLLWRRKLLRSGCYLPMRSLRQGIEENWQSSFPNLEKKE